MTRHAVLVALHRPAAEIAVAVGAKVVRAVHSKLFVLRCAAWVCAAGDGRVAAIQVEHLIYHTPC